MGSSKVRIFNTVCVIAENLIISLFGVFFVVVGLLGFFAHHHFYSLLSSIN